VRPRTLLLLAVLLACGCRQPHDDVLAAVRGVGGSAEADGDRPGRPVVTVDVHGSDVSDGWLARLEGLGQLRQLNLAATPITDAGLTHLRGLTELRGLNLAGTRITDAGLANLSGLTNLEELGLAGTGVTDAGLAHLKGLKRLARLNIFGTKVTEAGERGLKEALPAVEVQR
jgi:hypothetical protein